MLSSTVDLRVKIYSSTSLTRIFIITSIAYKRSAGRLYRLCFLNFKLTLV